MNYSFFVIVPDPFVCYVFVFPLFDDLLALISSFLTCLLRVIMEFTV